MDFIISTVELCKLIEDTSGLQIK